MTTPDVTKPNFGVILKPSVQNSPNTGLSPAITDNATLKVSGVVQAQNNGAESPLTVAISKQNADAVAAAALKGKISKKSNPWKIAAIVAGVIAIVALVALAVLFLPVVAGVGAGLLFAKIGAGSAVALFGGLSIGLGVKAHRVATAQAEEV